MADKESRSGSRYGNAEVMEYAERTHIQEHGLKLEIALDDAFKAPELHGMPSIQLAQSEAKLLSLLIALCGAKRVVEFGTLAGYSAIWIAKSLPEDGLLYTIEPNPKHAAVAAEMFARAGLADRIKILPKTGLEACEELRESGPFDAIFIDADKENYDAYTKWALEQLRTGGLIIADNAYFFGRLLENSDAAAAMRSCHEQIAQACFSTCIPTPDGLLVGRKKSSRADG